jgi:uncharacterized protein with FMN-binding domain
LMSFHTKPATLSLNSLGVTTTTRGSAGSADSRGTSKSTTTTTSTPARTTTTTTDPAATTSTTRPTPVTTTTTTTTTTTPSTTRTVVGTSVNYSYGTLAVSVTGSASRITNVSIASISDGGDSRSQSIDQYAIPILESQALSAQSANIQGVSGASYTSAGFEQSLQSALIKLRPS